MEKQSLIKYYYAAVLFLVLLANFNNVAVGQNQQSLNKENTSLSPTVLDNGEQNKPFNNMQFPIILSILALIASGGAIALSIVKNKQINHYLDSLDKKYSSKLEALERKHAVLLDTQNTTQSHPQRETISRISAISNNTNPYLESITDRLSERISEIEHKLQVSPSNERASNYFTNKSSYNQSTNLVSNTNPFQQTEITQPIENLAYIELVNSYNYNPRILEQKAIKVSEAKDSISRRHSDSSQQIVLEQATNPNYWVIRDDAGTNYWLIPKSKLRIDQFRYETTKALFECQGYYPEYSVFKLVKPAKVIPLTTDEQTWQLEEPGILEFILDS